MATRTTSPSRPTTARRAVGVGWLVVLAPLLLIGVLVGASQREDTWLREVGKLQLPGLLHIQAASDRRGDHVAVLDRAGAIHVLGLRGQHLQDSSLAVPWRQDEQQLRSTRLVFAPAGHDELLDLTAIKMPPRRFSGMPDWDGGDWKVARYDQRGDGFAFEEIHHRPPSLPDGGGSQNILLQGVSYLMRDVATAGGKRNYVQLLRARDNRPAFSVRGGFFASADLDGDGNQDLITRDQNIDDQGLAQFRIHVYRNRGFREVWQGCFDEGDPTYTMRRWVVLADLDGDGVMELVGGEPETGRLSVVAFDPAKLRS
ncbi:MAG: VCBS repeat-containing protein [Fimbriimonadaceae bacterium]|nr:VCBS repeat-containing protein [Fimbriimonadaceae bacterium]